MKIDLSSSTKKENSTENSAEKYLKEDSKFYEFWNVSTKQKKKKKKKRKEKKRKILKFKEFCLPNTLYGKFQQIVQKICNAIFSIPIFLDSFV